MGNFGGILEEQNATRNADREGQAQEDSDRNENSIGNCARDHSIAI